MRQKEPEAQDNLGHIREILSQKKKKGKEKQYISNYREKQIPPQTRKQEGKKGKCDTCVYRKDSILEGFAILVCIFIVIIVLSIP